MSDNEDKEKSSQPIDPTEAENILKELAGQFFFSPPNLPIDLETLHEADAIDKERESISARYSTLLEQISAIVFMISLNKRISEAYVSPHIETTLGFTQQEWLEDPMLWYQQIHPDDKARWSVEAADLFLYGRSLRSVYRVIARDRHIVWFHCEAKMVRNADGRPWFIHGVAFDITELKEVEKKLEHAHEDLEAKVKERTSELARANSELILEIAERKQAEERIRQQAALLDITSDAIMVCGLDDNILYWNRGAEHLYGWAAQEVMGKNALQLLYYEPLAIIDKTDNLIIGDGNWQGELNQIDKTGKKIVVESRWTLMKNDRGEAISKLIVNTNITEKKELEAQLLRVQRMESVGMSASGIAHDLNNMLSPVLLSMQLLRNKLPLPHDQKFLNSIESSVQRGADLIRQILSFAQGNEERNIVNPNPNSRELNLDLSATGATTIDSVTDLKGHGELILVVDDEATIRSITKVSLEAYGYKVLTANDGADAIKIYVENIDRIKVVLTDMMMPNMDGQSTIRVLQRLNPKIRIIASSGLLENSIEIEAERLKVHTILLKPYRSEELLQAIHKALL